MFQYVKTKKGLQVGRRHQRCRHFSKSLTHLVSSPDGLLGVVCCCLTGHPFAIMQSILSQ